MAEQGTRNNTRKKQTPPQQDPDLVMEETPQDANPIHIPTDLKIFLNSMPDENSYIVVVYKVEEQNGKPKKVYCDEYQGSVPSVKDIGRRFGSGTFVFMTRVYDQGGDVKLYSCRFHLHKSYDAPDPADTPALAGVPQVVPPMAPASNLAEALTLIKEVASIMTPIITPLLQNNQGPAGQGAAAQLEAIAGVMSTAISKMGESQLESQIRMINMIKDKAGEMVFPGTGSGDDEEENPVDQVMEYLKQYLPTIAQWSMKQLAGMAGPIRQDPAIQAVISDEQRTAEFLRRLQPEVDPQTYKKIIKVFFPDLVADAAPPAEQTPEAVTE